MTPDTQVLVLRVKRARNPDAVGLALLEGFLDRMKARGVARAAVRRARRVRATRCEKTGLAERLGERVFLEQPVRQTSTCSRSATPTS